MRTYCHTRAKQVFPGSDGRQIASVQSSRAVPICFDKLPLGSPKTRRTPAPGDASNAIITRTKCRQVYNHVIESPRGRSTPTVTLWP